ncbi:MAG: transporter substrate-binding domain-containing protein [Roseobacter sp.]
MKAVLKELAKDGVLRVAINTGNRALVQQNGHALEGISPALARRLADELGAGLDTIVYEGAGKVFADADQGIWEVAFLAIDPKRAEKIAFTRPYITIEVTFAVWDTSIIRDVSDVDRAGHRILTSVGSAYDLHLTKTLQRASLDRVGTPPQSFEAFRAGDWDAVVGVRASLDRAFAQDASIRILPGVLTKVEQAMVLPHPTHPATAELDDFVKRALGEGFVADVLSGDRPT